MRSKKLTKNNLKEINGLLTPFDDNEYYNAGVNKAKIKRIKTSSTKKEHYVNPDEFKKQILTYHKSGIMTNELGKSVHDIANRLAFSPNFINYTYREEMIGDAIIKMFQALNNKKFNKNIVNKNGQKGNAYSYFTKIAFNSFRNRIKKEKRNHEALLGYQSKIYEMLINTGNVPDDQETDMINNDSRLDVPEINSEDNNDY